MNDVTISVTDAPSDDAIETIGSNLTQFNADDVGPANRQALAVLVHDADGNHVAGISGYTAWGWLYVQWLWVAENQRGRKLAGRMLAVAEDEAKRRNCHAAYIDTFNPVALKTYQKAGYAPFGELKDFPKGRTRVFLQKSL